MGFILVTGRRRGRGIFPMGHPAERLCSCRARVVHAAETSARGAGDGPADAAGDDVAGAGVAGVDVAGADAAGADAAGADAADADAE
ncbi:hypothetical protein ACFSL4_36695, partial [Streptomyces caeni]